MLIYSFLLPSTQYLNQLHHQLTQFLNLFFQTIYIFPGLFNIKLQFRIFPH